MSKKPVAFANPFRPGAGHMPPFLAGRQKETEEYLRLLVQEIVMENLVLTGLRGVGKTVLLDTFKPLATQQSWAWVGTDLSESASISEERIAIRLMTDLAVLTSSVIVEDRRIEKVGFNNVKTVSRTLDFAMMLGLFQQTPGLVSDKLKAVLEIAWQCLKSTQTRGLIFAYDEAQNLTDHAAKNEYPLSLMLDVFQSLQKKGVPFMLALTGLPTLFPKLVEARTFSERMFHVVFLDRLNPRDSREAILKPIRDTKCPISMRDDMVTRIVDLSGGYPYFIQFFGREVYDVVQQIFDGKNNVVVPFNDIVRKLDTDFFAGRWARATDRQRDILTIIAHLENADSEFTVQEVTEKSKELLKKSFSPSHANQMLAKLSDMGLVYKNRHGKYSYAVPLLGRFILRQQAESAGATSKG
jgi:hypothetical protein